MFRNLQSVRILSKFKNLTTTTENETVSVADDLSTASLVQHRSDDESHKPKRLKKEKSFTIPKTYDGIIDVTSCSSIRVGFSSISCASFEISAEAQTMEVTNWENYTYNEKKLHVGELVSNVIKISKHIPESQCYIFENPKIATPGSPGNAEKVNINIQQAQVFAMLSLILSQRNQGTCENVFYLKRYIYARLFKLLVGTEVVTIKAIVNEIFEQDRGYLNLKIKHDIKSKFDNLENFEQEYLGQTLLLGIAFIKLSIFKCEKSLKSMERRKD